MTGASSQGDDGAPDDGAWPHGSGGGPLPPRREQLPLPRRDGQSHLEPQLREPGGAGSGTPFQAFEDSDRDAPAAPAAGVGSGEVAAVFRAATRRTRSPRHAAPEPDQAAGSDQAGSDRDASR